MGREIERKWLVDTIPADIADYPHKDIIQGYLCFDPVVRVRKDGNDYYLTYKGKGHIERAEYNLPLNPEAFESLIRKCEGCLIEKTRYHIPYSVKSNNEMTVSVNSVISAASAVEKKSNYKSLEQNCLDMNLNTGMKYDDEYIFEYNREYMIDLDVFSGVYRGKVYAEVEFDNVSEANEFVPPDWFGEDVSGKAGYSNAELARNCIYNL